jgi:hypothetical protein
MAGIVGVHGIAQQFRGGHQFADGWFKGIPDGLMAVGIPRTAETLASSDVHVAFFGDLFPLPGIMATAVRPYLAADIELGLEGDLFTVFFEAAVAEDPALGREEGAMGPGRVTIQVMLNRLAPRKDLSQMFLGTVQGQIVVDRLVDNSDELHAIDRYLNTLQTGSVIGNVLG